MLVFTPFMIKNLVTILSLSVRRIFFARLDESSLVTSQSYAKHFAFSVLQSVHALRPGGYI